MIPTLRRSTDTLAEKTTIYTDNSSRSTYHDSAKSSGTEINPGIVEKGEEEGGENKKAKGGKREITSLTTV